MSGEIFSAAHVGGTVPPIIIPSVIRDILKHLGIWLVRSRPPPKIHDPPVCMHSTGRPAAPYIMDDVCGQLFVNDDHLYRDAEYSWDEYIQA
jgi:hypothetical protein